MEVKVKLHSFFCLVLDGVSGQLHDSAHFHPEGQSLLPTEQDAERAQKPVRETKSNFSGIHF